MQFLLVATLAGHTYLATPARYTSRAECERVAVVLAMTSIRARYECREA